MNEPAALSAAARPPTAKAKAPPTSSSLSTSQVMSMTPVGSVTPLETTGESPMASATATIPRTRAGTSFELNIGASTKSGLDAREHEDEGGDVLLAEAPHEVGDGHPTRVGIRDQRSVV